MSASAVRGGQVYVEIGANPSKLLNALRIVNTKVAGLGSAMMSIGGRMAMAGGAITAPIAAAGMAFAAQNEQVLRAQKSLAGVASAIGDAVAPAVVGLAKIVADAADKITVFIGNNKNLVRVAFALGAAMTAGGISLSVFGKYLRDASTVAAMLATPIGFVADSLLSVGTAAARGATGLVFGLLSATVAAGKLSASIATVSVRVGASAVRAFSALRPLVERVGVAFIEFGISAAGAAERMIVGFAVANPYLAAMAAMAGTVVVILATMSASSAKASGEVRNAGNAMGGFGESAQAAFQKVMSAFSMSSIGDAMTASIGPGVENAKILFGDLYATADTTVTGVYNAIAAGDWGTAVDILWAGATAAWTRGQQAVMGALDPWIEATQNVFTDLGTEIAARWDGAWTALATSEWGGYVLGAMDNVLNGIMATWDQTIGYLQKGWAQFSGWWSGDTEKMKAEIDRIDAANAGNAAQRGRDRPGFAGRTGLSDEEKAKMRAESEQRQQAMRDNAEKTKADRAARTAQNVQDRAAAVANANAALKEKVGRTSEPPPVEPPKTAKVSTEVAGTFSAFGVGQMAGGSVQKQQLDALLKIQAGIEESNRVGAVVA